MALRSPPARSFLLASLVGTAVLLPPEMHPIGLATVCLLAFVLGFSLLRSSRDPAQPLGLEIAGLAWILLLLRISPDRHASGMILLFLLLAVTAFRAGRDEAFRGDSERLFDTMVLLGGLVSLWGLYQAAVGLPGTARALRALGQPELDAMVLRAESGRAFGPFPLPADLGIFIAMSLPLALRKLLAEKGRAANAAGIGVVAILLAGIAASRSYGAVFSLGIAALILLPASRIRFKLPALMAVAGTGAAAGVAFFLTRGAEGFSPWLLRMRNWGAAGRLFFDNPALGVGLGGFGDAVTRVMTTGMDETIFAHNSYLQISVEAGLVGLAVALLGTVLLVGRMLGGVRRHREPAAKLLLCLPPLAFLVHNLFDFSAYLPSLAIPFAALAGAVSLSSLPGVPRRPAPSTSARQVLRRAATVVLLAVMLGWGLRESRAASLIRSAKESALTQAVSASLTLRRAAGLSPCHPDPPAMLSELGLARVSPDPQELRDGEAWGRRAVRLRVSRAYGYYVLSLYRLAAGDPGEAAVMLSRARERYPARELYRAQEKRLQEMLAGSGDPGEGSDAP